MRLLSDGLMMMTALMLTLLLMPLSIRLAFVLGALDQPDERKVHGRAMPRLGGAAIAAAVIGSCLMFLEGGREVTAILAGAVVIMLTGMADDIWRIRPWQKFAGEILAAGLFVLISGSALRSLGDIVGTGPVLTGSFAVPVTIFAIVGVINALNLSDGLDGLAGGLAAIACLFLGFFAFHCQHGTCLALIMALFGSILGFLYYNVYPARVFMGDAGSLMLGYILAVVAVLLAGGGAGGGVAPVSMALVLALPILDTLLVMGRRLAHGYSPFTPDKTHLHHRLLNLGLPHAAVVPVIYGCMALFGFAAIAVMRWPEWMQFALGLAMASVLYGTVIGLSRCGYRWRDRGGLRAFRNRETRLWREMTAWTGRSIPVMTWLIPLILLLPAFSLTPASAFGVVALAISLSILILFPWSAGEERLGLAHGLIYLGVYCIVAMYALYAPSWVVGYMAGATVLVSCWVVVKLIFKRHGRVFLTSGFELLMIIVSWFVPVFLRKEMPLAEDLEKALFVACLEAIPFLLAMKIIIRRQPRRNRPLAASLAGIMLLVALRSLA